MNSDGWGTCPRCGRRLYPNTARHTLEGWACANRSRCTIHAQSDALGEEIAWLRSFGWSPARIAERLGVTESCVEKRMHAAKVGVS